jgi:hypothetical protein
MGRKIAVSIEDLEGRALLSGIVYSLTTDQSAYQVGKPIKITFTEKNTGDQPVTVYVSPTDFTVSEHGSPIWKSNPANDGQPPTAITLQSGQSVSQTATWDGTIAETADQDGTTMTYAVNQWGAFQVSNPNAPQEDTATFQIANPLTGALTTDQSIYQLGQPVQLTYTEMNTSSQTVTFSTQTPVIYQIMHDGQPELPVTDPKGQIFQTLSPDQTFVDRFTWRPGSGNDASNGLSGPFVAMVYAAPAAPGQFTADFEIVTPPPGGDVLTRSSSGNSSTSGTGDGGSSATAGNAAVTTNHADYKVGDRVRIRLKIPGAVSATSTALPVRSRELITILDGTQVVSRVTHRVPSSTFKHLKAGRSVTLTTFWNGRPNQPGIQSVKPGTYTIDAVYGDYRGSTAIAIGRKDS